jgi:hypothetical protein
MTIIPDDATVPRTDTDLIKQFESLGDNCEFGLVQRYAGAEPLGLLRFNFTSFTSLLAGLQTQFCDLHNSDQVRVVWHHNEWFVTERSYGFSYHTFNYNRFCDPDELASKQSRWLRYMAEKFFERLMLEERIFVRKGEDPSCEEDIRLLHAALRRFGEIVLLWVCVADEQHEAGRVEWIGNGLMRGWISGFAPYNRAVDVDLPGWIKLCRRAWALWRLGDADGYPMPNVTTESALSFGGWSGSSVAVSELAWEVPPPPAGGHVMRHRLINDTAGGQDIFGCLISSGLQPGNLYVVSVWIWLPTDFSGRYAGLVILGRPSLRLCNATHALSGRWQQVWTSAFLGADQTGAFPRLVVDGPPGVTLYTSGWRLEQGVIPAAIE